MNEGSAPDECTCPYYMGRGYCKHALARLYKENGEDILPDWVKNSKARTHFQNTRVGSIYSKVAAGTVKNYRPKNIGRASMTYTEVNVARGEGREPVDTPFRSRRRRPFNLPMGNVWLRCLTCLKWHDVHADLKDMENPNCFKMGLAHYSGRPCKKFCVRCGLCTCVCSTDPKEVLIQRDIDARTAGPRNEESFAANAANAANVTSGTSSTVSNGARDGASDEASAEDEVSVSCSTPRRQPKRTRSHADTLPPRKKRRIPLRSTVSESEGDDDNRDDEIDLTVTRESGNSVDRDDEIDPTATRESGDRHKRA